MNRNLWLLSILLLTSCLLAQAQQPKKIPRIGFLAASGDFNHPGLLFEAFRQGLRDFGYIDGINVRLEYRSAEGNLDRMPNLLAELVQLKVDVLVVQTLIAIRAAKQATKSPLPS